MFGGPWFLLACAPRDPAEQDRDRDGYPGAEDCDDRDADRHPEAADPPGDGVDRDCDGADGRSDWLGAVGVVHVPDQGWIELGFSLAARGALVAAGSQERSGFEGTYDGAGGEGVVSLLEGPRLRERRRWRGEGYEAFLGTSVAIDRAGTLLTVGAWQRRYVWELDLPSGVPSRLGAPWFDTGSAGFPAAFGDLSGGSAEELVMVAYVDGPEGTSTEVRVCADPRSGEPSPDDTVLTGVGAEALAVGDLDGDGAGDLVLGWGSTVSVVRGPLAPGGALGPDAVWRTFTADHPDDELGAALLTADLDGDGRDELVVSAPEWPAGERRGRVHVLDAAAGTLADARFVLDGDAPDAFLGRSLAVADLDGDGVRDLVVGVPGSDGPGRVLLFRGPLDGHATAADADRSWSGIGLHDAAGFAITVADLDADGAPDLVIGAPRHGAEASGAVHALRGPL